MLFSFPTFLRAATLLPPNTDLLLLFLLHPFWALEDVRHQARPHGAGKYIFLYKTHIQSLLSIMTEGWKVEGSDPSDAAPSIAVKETPLLTEWEKRTQVARVRWRLWETQSFAFIFAPVRLFDCQRGFKIETWTNEASEKANSSNLKITLKGKNSEDIKKGSPL